MSRNISISSEKLKMNSLHKEITSNNGKLIYTKIRDRFAAFLIRDNRLIALQLFSNESRLGAVYIARVKDVVPQLNAIFLKISPDEEVFLKMTNLSKDYSNLHQGDLIPVQIIAESQRGKRAVVSARIKWDKLPNGNDMKAFWNHKAAYTCLFEGKLPVFDFIDKMIHPQEINEIVTDSKDAFQHFEDFVSESNIYQNLPIRLYEDDKFPLSKLYSLEHLMEEAIAPKVWLKSGGYLIINHTEALTVIDVNSGKYEASKQLSKDESAYNLNLEAMEECARQIRLRNISGMILIDLINVASEYEPMMLSEMAEWMKEDPCTTQIVDITPLGIMELTRGKKYKSLLEQMEE